MLQERSAGSKIKDLQDELSKYKEKMEEYYHKILIYELLIQRYTEQIEINETKTIPDLKALVQPTNSNITPIIQKIKSEASDFLDQCRLAYDFIDEVHSVPYIGTTFWLTIKEMLDNKVADYEDKAILLCSVLRGLGANARIAVVMLSDGSNRPLVTISLKDGCILLDPNRKHDFEKYIGKKNALIKRFSTDKSTVKRVIYEFNDKDYISSEV